MKNPKRSTTVFLLFFIIVLALSNFVRSDDDDDDNKVQCIKRNFNYPSPSGKPVIHQIQEESSSPPSSSSKEEKEKEESSSEKESASESGSESQSESALKTDQLVDSPDEDPSSNFRFGDMLKQAVNKIDPNSPILNIPNAEVDDPDVKKMCDATDYPDLCQSTVAHLMGGKKDPVSMLEMLIKACVQYTQVALTTAKKVSESPAFARIRSRFTEISEYYEDALENFQDAANAIKVKDMPTVNINLSAALDDVGAYEDDFGGTSPMADFDAKLTRMASNCLAIATLVKFH